MAYSVFEWTIIEQNIQVTQLLNMEILKNLRWEEPIDSWDDAERMSGGC